MATNNNEFFDALAALEKERGLPADYLIDKIKAAIVIAVKKDYEVEDDNVVVDIDPNIGAFRASLLQDIVEEVENPHTQVSLEDAQKIRKTYKVGQRLVTPLKTKEFGRIAAQTAKQVVIQGIREAERGVMYESYSNKSQELMTGTVFRTVPATGDVLLKVGQGNDASEAMLRSGEQIPGETYTEGQILKVYVLDVRKSDRGPLVQVSRTHPNLVRRLFELETPEIAEGQVEIRNIAREPGSRSKMAVRAAMEGIDPVGACVGPRGGRVNAVVEELHGEKIEIVVWSEDPCQYVKAALSPADVISVSLVPGQKACSVVVPDDQLSLAIGKEGQNARLAARLTGYKIDIKSASQVQEPAEEATEEA